MVLSPTGDDSKVTSNHKTEAENKLGFVNEGFKLDSGDDLKKSNSVIPTDAELAASGKFKVSKREKWRILKNVAAVSLAFMVQFTAFQGTANLQSSINAKDGLGTVSLSSIYTALVLSCIFVPTFVIKRLTVKWSLCFSMLCYAPYIAAQFYPRFYTLIPAGVLLGIGAAPMWASKATYITQVAGVYAKLTEQAVDAIIVRFFGFFFLAWQTAELWGNLISSLGRYDRRGIYEDVMATGTGIMFPGQTSGEGKQTVLFVLVLSSGAHHSVFHHKEHNVTDEALELCGANFCVSTLNANDNLERPPDWEIYEISAIYLTCILVAVMMVAFLVDPLSRYGEKQKKKDSTELTGIQLLSATAIQLKKPLQQLLIPITVWIGMEQAFIGADYTQAYISCALGISSVGYVMICFGVVNAVCSVLFGSLMKFVGRFPIMTLGFIVHTALVVTKLTWAPSPDHPFVFFIVSGLWGVGDAVWQTQVNGLYGTLFRRNKEAAFSNYRLWESAGFVIAYAYSTALCARMKLYVMLTVLCIGFLGYLIVEILQRRKKRKQKEQEEDPKITAAAAAEAEVNSKKTAVEETDDEKDDIDDDIIVTHL